MRLEIRRATAADQDVLRRALYGAWRWREPWSEHDFQQHLARNDVDSYVDDFDRRQGDVGFVGRPAGGDRDGWSGAAWCRLFTPDDHRIGYLAADVPELVVAVLEEARGHGLGSALLGRLTEHADAQEVPGMSLHVASENLVAQHLYEAWGFVVAEDRGDRGLVMYRELGRRPLK